MATTPTIQSKIRKALKNEHVKTAILIVILIGGMVSFVLGIRIFLRTDSPFMTVVTGSMVPTLNIGDLIVVEGYANISTIHTAPKTADPPGDILVFLHLESGRDVINLVHRAVGEFTYNGKRYLITLGDANGDSKDTHYNLTTGDVTPRPYPNAPFSGLPEEYVIGKVIANVPVIGNILIFLQTPGGRIIIIGLIIVFIVVEFIPFSKKKDKEQTQAPVPEQEQVKG